MYGAGEYDNGFGLDAFQTLVGVAQAQPQVVIATVAPPAAQEVHQEEDESPDGLPDGDGSGGAEKTGAWPQRDKLDLVRLDAARQIQTDSLGAIRLYLPRKALRLETGDQQTEAE